MHFLLPQQSTSEWEGQFASLGLQRQYPDPPDSFEGTCERVVRLNLPVHEEVQTSVIPARAHRVDRDHYLKYTVPVYAEKAVPMFGSKGLFCWGERTTPTRTRMARWRRNR